LVIAQNKLVSCVEGLTVIHDGKWMMGAPGLSKIFGTINVYQTVWHHILQDRQPQK